jgi:hypothetical protein
MKSNLLDDIERERIRCDGCGCTTPLSDLTCVDEDGTMLCLICRTPDPDDYMLAGISKRSAG